MLFPALSSHSAWLFPSWLILIVYIQRFSILLTYQISLSWHTKICLVSLGKCNIFCWEAAVYQHGMSNQSVSVQLYSDQTSSGFYEVSRSFPNIPESTESSHCWEALTNAICQRNRIFFFRYHFVFTFFFFLLCVFAHFLKHGNFRLLLVPGQLLDLPFNSLFLWLFSDR